MKIAKCMWVDEKVRWNPMVRWNLERKNRLTPNSYLICLLPESQWLFEVIHSRQLCKYYSRYILVGIASTKEKAIEYVRQLVDDIYNKKCLTYENLIT